MPGSLKVEKSMGFAINRTLVVSRAFKNSSLPFPCDQAGAFFGQNMRSNYLSRIHEIRWFRIQEFFGMAQTNVNIVDEESIRSTLGNMLDAAIAGPVNERKFGYNMDATLPKRPDDDDDDGNDDDGIFPRETTVGQSRGKKATLQVLSYSTVGWGNFA